MKAVKTTLEGAPAEAAPVHWAQAECYAHMLCQAEGLPSLEVCVTYLSLADGEITRFVRTHTRQALAEKFEGYVRPYLAWLDGLTRRRAALAAEMRALTFPWTLCRLLCPRTPSSRRSAEAPGARSPARSAYSTTACTEARAAAFSNALTPFFSDVEWV